MRNVDCGAIDASGAFDASGAAQAARSEPPDHANVLKQHRVSLARNRTARALPLKFPKQSEIDFAS